MNVFLIAAFLLLIVGVLASFTPMLPGGLFSIAGILIYWWSTNYTNPSTLFVIVAVLTGVLTLAVDWFAGAISAKAGGASKKTTVISALVGLAMFFIAGPVGVLAGVAVTVFMLEFYEKESAGKGLQAAFYSVIGILASSVAQALLTVSILFGFILAVIF